MNTNNFAETWERYVSSWKSDSDPQRQALFESCLDVDCQYTDPLIQAKGWQELAAYMRDFHKQIPGGHFVTTYFLAHHGKSIAKWEMRNQDAVVLGEGVSYGEYSAQGKLRSMTGFFDAPPS